ARDPSRTAVPSTIPSRDRSGCVETHSRAPILVRSISRRQHKLLATSGLCGLAVHPYPTGAAPAEALAPGRNGFPARDRDLSVVPVRLEEPIRGLVVRPRRSVGDLDRVAPIRPAVDRGPVPDVPLIGVVAVGGLH